MKTSFKILKNVKFLGVQWTGEPVLSRSNIRLLDSWLHKDLIQLCKELRSIPELKLFNTKLFKMERDLQRLNSLRAKSPAEYFNSLSNMFKTVSDILSFMKKKNLIQRIVRGNYGE